MPLGFAGSAEAPSGRTAAGTCGGSMATELTTPPLMSASSPRPNAFFCMVEIHLLCLRFYAVALDLSRKNQANDKAESFGSAYVVYEPNLVWVMTPLRIQSASQRFSSSDSAP